MAEQEHDDVWRLPKTVRVRDVRLGRQDGPHAPLPAAAKARLHRIVSRVPEVMVRLTGRSREGAGHLKAHLDYITRNGLVHGEIQSGERITDHARLRALHDEWLLANAADARGKPRDNAAQSVGLILSMPPGTPPDRLEAAARTWARETFAQRYDWIMARHDDTDHPHVHVTVRAVGYDGRRLSPGPAELQGWRERFARELRRLGIEAEATPRQARGVVRKSAAPALYHSEKRGRLPAVRRNEQRAAEREARAPELHQPRDWSRDIQARQESIRRAYLEHADRLAAGDAADQKLARDIRRFVADMPVPLTRRQALAVELRQVLEQRSGREAPPAGPPAAQQPASPQRSSPSLSQQLFPAEPTRKLPGR